MARASRNPKLDVGTLLIGAGVAFAGYMLWTRSSGPSADAFVASDESAPGATVGVDTASDTYATDTASDAFVDSSSSGSYLDSTGDEPVVQWDTSQEAAYTSNAPTGANGATGPTADTPMITPTAESAPPQVQTAPQVQMPAPTPSVSKTSTTKVPLSTFKPSTPELQAQSTIQTTQPAVLPPVAPAPTLVAPRITSTKLTLLRGADDNEGEDGWKRLVIPTLLGLGAFLAVRQYIWSQREAGAMTELEADLTSDMDF